MKLNNITTNIAKYITDIGVNLSELSRKSGVGYAELYASVGGNGRGRALRADELASICFVLKINPMDFADQPEEVET